MVVCEENAMNEAVRSATSKEDTLLNYGQMPSSSDVHHHLFLDDGLDLKSENMFHCD